VAEVVRSEAGVDRRLMQLASNPAGMRVLELLAGRSARPEEIATALGLSLPEAREQVRELRGLGLIELAGQRAEDGAAEGIYRAIATPMWSTEEVKEMSLQERQHLGAWIAQMIGCDVVSALKAGTFNAHHETHLSRTRFVLDAQGWRELNRIQDEALNASFAVQAASAERLAESGEEGMHVMGAMLSVEMPLPSHPA
jgi:DNA-binding transcriptional ArsR family regulator